MTEADRDRAFKSERLAQRRAYGAARRETLKKIQQILKAGRQRIAAELAGTPSDFQAWQLPTIQAAIDREMAAVGRELGKAAADGAAAASQIGVALVDEPLKAAGVRLSAVLTDIDSRQLSAIRAFMVDKMADVTAETAAKIKTEIGVAMIGADGPSGAVGRIAQMVEGGRGRALSIVRTEMGTAFSVSHQERLTQAREVLPGLRKQWRRSGKLHSRQTHDLADGQIVEVDQPFIVGGVKLMYPRDPKGPVGERVNCGCESLPIMEHWEVVQEGRAPITDEETLRNPAKRDLANALNPAPDASRVAAMERLEPVLAKRAIAEEIGGKDFGAFVARPPLGEHRPVAVLPSHVQQALGSSSRILRLSSYTVTKQRRSRMGQAFTAQDYGRAQEILDSGIVLHEAGGAVQAFQMVEGGEIWKAVLKATADGRETYLQSLHKSNARQMKRARRTLQEIARE